MRRPGRVAGWRSVAVLALWLGVLAGTVSARGEPLAAAAPARGAVPPPGAVPGGAAVPLPPAAPAAKGPQITGFRGATFGMTEAEVRGVIGRDFHLPPPSIQTGENPVERTAILSVRVADLSPGAGGAIVSYVFGYRSHRLIEVNIVWSKVSDASLTPKALAVIGARLQAYFAGEHFAPGRSALNVPLPNGLLLFRTVDQAGRAIALILSGPVKTDAKSGKRVLTPTTLSLAYAADATHPDVFRLEKGSF
ncbi:MAG: hypothetical protein M0002_18945 [Rhodospirillales bacterium]|nr:hypothetical protein [Rhodospirillales bacterium]